MRHFSRQTVAVLAALFGVASFAVSNPAVAATTNTVPATFTINGSGFGHGIGMSQYGAYGMAIDLASNPAKLGPSCSGLSVDQRQVCAASMIVQNYYPGTTISDIADSATRALTSATTPGIRVGLKQDQDVIYMQGEKLNNLGGALDITVDANPAFTVSANTVLTFTHSTTTATLSYGTSNVTGSKFRIAWNGTTTNGANPGLLHLESVSSTATTPAQAFADTGCSSSTRSICHRFKYGTMEVDFGAFGNNSDGSADTNKDFQVVNILRLSDEYLYGLGEVPSSWYHYQPSSGAELNTSAALQAQAIAARTYALQKVRATTATDPNAVRAACQCHVYSDTSDQAFIGYVKEASLYGAQWKAAVDATRGTASGTWKVITLNGSPIQAFFSSSTGGFGQPVSEVWGSNQNSYPYLVKTDDRYALDSRTGNPYTNWAVQISQSTLVTKLNQYLAGQGSLTDIASISVGSKTASGAVTSLVIVNSAGVPITINVRPSNRWVAGQLDISPDQIRSLIGAGSLIPGTGSGFNGSTYLTSITSGTSTTSASPKTKTPKLTKLTTSKWPKKLQSGKSLTISGAIKPVQSGVRITLQQKSAAGWIALNTTTTNTKGKWTTTWAAPPVGSPTLRIEAANAANALTTKTHKVIVSGSVSIAAPSTVMRSQPLTILGTVTPATANVAVVIERQNAFGKWVAFAKSQTSDTGTWTCTVTAPKKAGLLKLQARLINSTLGNATSKTASTRIR